MTKSSYSSYSTADLERMYRAVQKAYIAVDCPDYNPCWECCIRYDCGALRQVRDNIHKEIHKRRFKGGSTYCDV